MKVKYYSLPSPEKIDIIASNEEETILFSGREVKYRFTNIVIPLSNDFLQINSVKKNNKVYDAICLSENERVVGFGYVEESTYEASLVLKKIEKGEVEVEYISKPKNSQYTIIYFSNNNVN